jgi:N-acyl-L-homoserine lactone synthetase
MRHDPANHIRGRQSWQVPASASDQLIDVCSCWIEDHVSPGVAPGIEVFQGVASSRQIDFMLRRGILLDHLVCSLLLLLAMHVADSRRRLNHVIFLTVDDGAKDVTMHDTFSAELGTYQLFQVSSKEDRLLLYRLRHEIFREELQWLPLHPQGLDYDRYDEFSDNYAVRSGDGRLVGCVRLTLGNQPYMIEHEFARLLPAGRTLFKSSRTAEVTRLGVARDANGRRDPDVSRLIYFATHTWAMRHQVSWMYFVTVPTYTVRLSRVGFPTRLLAEPREMDGGVMSEAGYFDWDAVDPDFMRRLQHGMRIGRTAPAT